MISRYIKEQCSGIPDFANLAFHFTPLQGKRGL